MRKIIVSLLALILLLAIKTNAQIKDNLSLGPIVGFGHSWNNANYGASVDKKFNPSFNGGVRLVYSGIPNFGIGLDLTFRTEGVKFKQAALQTTTLHSNYIHLDPKAYYFFGNYGNAFRPKIGVGPGFGFLVGGKIKVEDPNFPAEAKAKDEIEGFDFGLSGSVGFNYRLKSKTWLNVDAVYNNGLTDVTKAKDIDPKNRSLFLNVGVTFGIGHAGKK